MKDKLLVATAVAFACFGLAACGSSSDESEPTTTATAEKQTGPIVIGAAVAKTGLMTAYDGNPFQALELAVKQTNDAGGIDGRKIVLKSRDTASDRGRGKTVAEQLLKDGAEMLVVSCDFDYGSPAAQVAQAAGKISFSLCAGSLKFGAQGIGDLAYSPANAAVAEGATAAEWALSKGWKSAYLLVDKTTAYAAETCSSFAERYKEQGGEIVGEDEFKNGDASIASQISRLKGVSPQPSVIRLCSYVPGVGTALRQLRAAGITTPIVGNMANDGTYWLDAVPKLSGFYYPAAASIYGDDPNPKVNDFFAEFEKATGAPAATSFAIYGKTLLDIYAQAVTEAGTTDAKAVAAKLDAFTDADILPGATTYTKDVHIQLGRPVTMIEVDGGKPRSIGTFKISKPAPFAL